MKKPDFGTEDLCIVGIVLIAVTAMHFLGVEAKSLVSALGGGLVGYLTRAVTK